MSPTPLWFRDYDLLVLLSMPLPLLYCPLTAEALGEWLGCGQGRVLSMYAERETYDHTTLVFFARGAPPFLSPADEWEGSASTSA